MSCKGYIVWMEPCRSNWITKRERGREGFFLISSFVMICHYTTLKEKWLPDFFALHLITCMPYCIVFYKADVLHHWQKPCSVPDTFCCIKVSTLLFPVGIFILVFFFVSSRIKVQIHDDNRRRNDHVWSLRYHIRGTSTVRI